MEHLSKIELIGRIGVVNVDTVAGQRHYRFSVGVDQVFRGGAGSTVKTSWFQCSYWGEGDKLQKGNEVHLEGRITSDSYTDLEGRSRIYYEVKVNKIW